MSRLGALAAAALFVIGAACGGEGSAAPGGSITVFATSSLSQAFDAMAEEFEKSNEGVEVRLNFAGTPQLQAQIREGAPADVFAPADREHLEELVDEGRVARRPFAFAGNRLALVVEPGNPQGIRGLPDLARPELTVALCAPEVPCGRYGRQALQRKGVTPKVDTEEPNVKAIVGKVALGEVDVGLVYQTDVSAGRPKVAGVDIPESDQVPITYTVATLKGSPDPETAAAFVAFVRSAAGQRILARLGYTGTRP